MLDLIDKSAVKDFFYKSKNYLFAFNADGILKFINPSFASALKIEEDRITSTPLEKYIHPDDWDQTNLFLNSYLKNSPYPGYLEVRIIAEDNEIKWLKWTSISVSESKDIYVIAHDITEAKKKQFESIDIQNKLFQIIELVPHPIFLKDNKGRYTLVNQAQANLFSVNKDQLIGKDDSYFTRNSEELKLIRESDLRVIENRESITMPEQIITRLDGSTKILNTIKIPFQGSTEEKISILGVSIDLTDIKKVEKELRITNFELDSFVYRSSHDLRAPLCSLTGLLNLIQKEKDPVLINNCIGEAKKSVKKLDSFISDLTNLSRNSRLEAKPLLIDFKELISGCIEDLQFMENAPGITYDIQIINERNFKFYSDEDRLKIIFMNLISNSIKYQKRNIENPEIQLTVQVGETTTITVSDNGIGIENIYQEKVFEMFFRASESSFGSGLGLYIVKQIANRLQGTISLQSSFGAGTRIQIDLPHLVRA